MGPINYLRIRGLSHQSDKQYRRRHKKPPMCQIMRFSLYCINGAVEVKHITLKNSNNTLLAMKSELHTEKFLLVHLPSIDPFMQ